MTEDLSVRESIIEGYLVRELKKLDWRIEVKKVGGPGWRGWPDRMACMSVLGVIHWLEVKRPRGGKFEPLQLRRHEKLRQCGSVVRVVNTKAAVDAYITELRILGVDGLSPWQS